MANRLELAGFSANRRRCLRPAIVITPVHSWTARLSAFRARNPVPASWAAPDIRIYQPGCKRSKHERDRSRAQATDQLDNGDDHDHGWECEDIVATPGASRSNARDCHGANQFVAALRTRA